MDDAPMLLTDKGKPDSTARHVLQVLAEHAHKDGSGAHPSVLRIQYRTGYDRRTVQRALRRLEGAGLIVADGMVRGCTRWRLALSVRRPSSDWEVLEAQEAAEREAAAERKRRSRSRRVTHSECVTEDDVTHSNSVTSGGVTHSASGCHALKQRDVTHSECVTPPDVTHSVPPEPPVEPPVEPPGSVPAAAPPARHDVEQICRALADAVEANGSKRPTITAVWRTSARLLLDKDGRTVEQVLTAIRWCQADPFWRANVMSLPTLRKQYDRLRLEALRRPGVLAPTGTAQTSKTQEWLADMAAIAKELAQGGIG